MPISHHINISQSCVILLRNVSAFVARAIRYTVAFAAIPASVSSSNQGQNTIVKKPNSTVGNKYSANSTNVDLSFIFYEQQSSGIVAVDLY